MRVAPWGSGGLSWIVGVAMREGEPCWEALKSLGQGSAQGRSSEPSPAQPVPCCGALSSPRLPEAASEFPYGNEKGPLESVHTDRRTAHTCTWTGSCRVLGETHCFLIPFPENSWSSYMCVHLIVSCACVLTQTHVCGHEFHTLSMRVCAHVCTVPAGTVCEAHVAVYVQVHCTAQGVPCVQAHVCTRCVHTLHCAVALCVHTGLLCSCGGGEDPCLYWQPPGRRGWRPCLRPRHCHG